MAPANPWIFRQIEQYQQWLVGHDFSRAEHVATGSSALAAEGEPFPSQKSYDEPTEADRYQMIRTYFQMLLEEEMPGAEGKMKQFASWFTHGVPGGAALRKAIYEAKTGAEILERVENFFEERLFGAGALARET
jgi:tRNA-dihydrouridine synthase